MIVDPAVDAYAAAHTTAPEDHLRRLDERTAAELPVYEMLSGPVVGRLLETLVYALQPQLVLEIGTYSGYSALSMVRALPPGGRIVTLDIDERHAAFARAAVEEAGESERVDVRVGPALDAIAALDGPFGFVFIDADKTGYPAYVEAVLPKLAPGGLIALDNTLRGGSVLDPPEGDESARVMAELNAELAADERLVSVMLTVRDGITIVRKR